MNTRKKALFCLAMMAGAMLGTSLAGEGSAAWADWDDWGHRGGGHHRGYYQPGNYFRGYRPVNYGWGPRGGWNRGWASYGGYRPCGGWNRGGWGNRPVNYGWGGPRTAWGGGPRWRRGDMW